MKTAVELIDKYHLDTCQWTHKGFHGVLHTFFPVGSSSLRPLYDLAGISHDLAIFFVEKDYANWYWNDADMLKMREYVVQQMEENPRFLEELQDTWHEKLAIFKESYQDVTAASLAALSNEELIGKYETFYQAYVNEFGLAIGFQDPFSMHSDRFLEPQFKAVLPKDTFGEYFVLLLSPNNESFINKELRDRYRLLQEVQNDSSLLSLLSHDIEAVISGLKEFPNFQMKLVAHVKNYHWIQNNYAKVRTLDEAYFLGELQKSLSGKVDPSVEIHEMEEAVRQTRQRKKELIERLHLSKSLRNLITISEVFAYMQDERKKYVLISNYYQKLFQNEIGKRCGLSEQEMNYTILPEIRGLLEQGIPTRDELASRYEFCFCICTVNGYELISGNEARNTYERLFGQEKDHLVAIKGQIASMGTVRGTVKIVKTTHDLIKVEEGDILVASMTRPEMVVAIQKAAAIVTDEGGITCHAAIVSRELHIPCIIGTKTATSILKDGDRIIVDTTKGLVTLEV